jgi:hypothetical protein
MNEDVLEYWISRIRTAADASRLLVVEEQLDSAVIEVRWGSM